MHIPPINKLDPQQQAFLDKVSTFVDQSSSSFVINGLKGLLVLVNRFYLLMLQRLFSQRSQTQES